MRIDLFNWREWLYHYEVFTMRQGREQVFARVPTRWHAERMAWRACREFEISRNTVSWRRSRGLHPRKAAMLSSLVLLLVLLIPWLWLRVSLGVVDIAIIFGLLTSGLEWMKGGDDDR
jgi:Flp pilus assembly protein TadB